MTQLPSKAKLFSKRGRMATSEKTYYNSTVFAHGTALSKGEDTEVEKGFQLNGWTEKYFRDSGIDTQLRHKAGVGQMKK